MMKLELQAGKWLNSPSRCKVTEHAVEITTEPHTDFWQRSYYGFRNNSAPALLFQSDQNFTLTVKTSFVYKRQFDQCGIIIYLDGENWFKASIEYENEKFSRLGSVVTNSGYSDWATRDIRLPAEIWYRLSRRGPDFLIEHSLDGVDFKQMRVFHLHRLEDTTEAMGQANPPLPAKSVIQFGCYACSPSDSSFTALFQDFKFEPSVWLAHSPA